MRLGFASVVLAIGACGTTEPTAAIGPIDPATSLVSVARPLLFPGDTVRVMLQGRDARGAPENVGGATVVFTLGAGSSTGTFLPVVDRGDGTYVADFVGNGVGSGFTVATTINGQTVTSPAPTLRVVAFTRISAAGASHTGFETASGGYTCGVITTGDLYCWGISWFGIRGNGTAGSIAPGLDPTLVSGGYQWTDVATGNYFVCGLAAGGTAYCWGDGDIGQIGNGQSGNPPDVRTPTPVQGMAAFQAISVGITQGACAITTAHAAMCWGENPYGRIGNGNTTLSAVPAAVSGGLGFDAVSTSFSGTCGVATSGAAYCWGAGVVLGVAGPDAHTPVAVAGGHTFRPIIARHGGVACAVATDDATYCWGVGYTGNGSTGQTVEPTLVSGGHVFTSLAAGDQYHCGIVTDGSAYCWGPNKNGRLGIGTTSDALTPTLVSGGHAFLQLSAAQDHTCGVATDGNAYCWGANDKGELGTRSQTPSLTPVRVRLFSP